MYLVVWLTGNVMVLVSVVGLCQASLLLGWMTMCRWINLLYVARCPGQLSLAIPLWVGALSTFISYTGKSWGLNRQIMFNLTILAR